MMPHRAQAMLRTCLILLPVLVLLVGLWWTWWSIIPLGVLAFLVGMTRGDAETTGGLPDCRFENLCLDGLHGLGRHLWGLGILGVVLGLAAGCYGVAWIARERILLMGVFGMMASIGLPILLLGLPLLVSLGVRRIFWAQFVRVGGQMAQPDAAEDAAGAQPPDEAGIAMAA